MRNEENPLNLSEVSSSDLEEWPECMVVATKPLVAKGLTGQVQLTHDDLEPTSYLVEGHSRDGPNNLWTVQMRRAN